MAFVAQYSVTVAPLDQQVEAWLVSPLLILLFLIILIKALLELPFFYIGPLLVLVALALRKRLAIPLRTTCQKAKVEHKAKNEADRHFLDSMPLFIILVGAAAVVFEMVRVSPNAATDAYNTIQEFTDPKHDQGDPLSIKQRAIVERYSATYSKDQLLSLNEDERFVASQIAKHKRDRRWLYVESILRHFARIYAPKP